MQLKLLCFPSSRGSKKGSRSSRSSSSNSRAVSRSSNFSKLSKPLGIQSREGLWSYPLLFSLPAHSSNCRSLTRFSSSLSWRKSTKKRRQNCRRSNSPKKKTSLRSASWRSETPSSSRGPPQPKRQSKSFRSPKRMRHTKPLKKKRGGTLSLSRNRRRRWPPMGPLLQSVKMAKSWILPLSNPKKRICPNPKPCRKLSSYLSPNNCSSREQPKSHNSKPLRNNRSRSSKNSTSWNQRKMLTCSMTQYI